MCVCVLLLCNIAVFLTSGLKTHTMCTEQSWFWKEIMCNEQSFSFKCSPDKNTICIYNYVLLLFLFQVSLDYINYNRRSTVFKFLYLRLRGLSQCQVSVTLRLLRDLCGTNRQALLVALRGPVRTVNPSRRFSETWVVLAQQPLVDCARRRRQQWSFRRSVKSSSTRPRSSIRFFVHS